MEAKVDQKASIFAKLSKANPKLLAALFYGLITAAIVSLTLVIVRPPFVFRRSEEPQYLPRISVLTVLGGGVLCGAGVATAVFFCS